MTSSILALALALACGLGEVTEAHADEAEGLAKKVVLAFDGIARMGMPIWGSVEYIHSKRKAEWDIRYPFTSVPWELGMYKFEVMLGNTPLSPDFPKRSVVQDISKPGWSVAPPTSPRARLPLHLQYQFREPGIYQVRLLLADYISDGEGEPVAVSDWTPLEVQASGPQERREWSAQMRNQMPEDPGALVGDFLPSILACPNDDALEILRKCARSSDPLIQRYALNGFSYFSDEDIAREIIDLLRSAGPNDLTAHVLSWRRDLLQSSAEDIVNILQCYLKSDSATQFGGAIQALTFLKGHYDWSRQPDMPDRIEQEVYESTAKIGPLLLKPPELLRPLCLFLGSAKTQGDLARSMLWEIVIAETAATEQAITCITWRKDSRDLPELGKRLLGPDNHLQSLPYAMRRSYEADAIPFLLRALREAGNENVRYECARTLLLDDQPEAFAFLAASIRAGGRHRQRAIQEVRDHFDEQRRADEEQILLFLDAHSAMTKP